MTAEQAIRICKACDRFEWDRLEGATPRIEHFLDAAPDDDRCQLLEDLLRIELEWRRAAGERPAPLDYTGRFPAEAERIERILRESAEAEDESPRRSVGRYELLEEMGRGREGVVYRAREGGIASREVAVKLLSAGSVGSRADALRFIKEVRSLAWIHHDHIVPYHDSGDDRGQLYYVMRLMRGSSLAGLLRDRRGPMEPMDAARLLIRVTEAVHHLHSRHPPIVHRDLKPGNILLDEEGKPYVADFGLAVLLEGEGWADGACGTIPYIAPEQFDRRFGEVGPACDVYSLGVILYELITGRPPFPRGRESILLTLDREPLPPGRLRAGVPGNLERVCMKCLRKSTRDRYASTGELLADLRHFERHEPLSTPPDGPWPRLWHWARREPALAVRLGVIVTCSAIMWGSRVASGRFAALLPHHWARLIERSGVYPGSLSIEAVLVWLNQVIFIAWGLASWAFQRRLNLRRDQGGLQFGWRVVDVAILTLLIELDDAVMSPLTVAFAVLIVASAFWARADQILQTTLLSMAGYVLLVLSFRHFHPAQDDRPWRHVHYLVGLAVLGLMLTYQANRTRALARICGDRD